jgi:hypothetical protein
VSDGVTYLALAIGFAFILVAGARLGAGSHHALAGLFPARGVRDWPTGVQEGDAPRFAVFHLDALRPDTPVRLEVGATDDDEGTRPEMIELASRRHERAR